MSNSIVHDNIYDNIRVICSNIDHPYIEEFTMDKKDFYLFTKAAGFRKHHGGKWIEIIYKMSRNIIRKAVEHFVDRPCLYVIKLYHKIMEDARGCPSIYMYKYTDDIYYELSKFVGSRFAIVAIIPIDSSISSNLISYINDLAYHKQEHLNCTSCTGIISTHNINYYINCIRGYMYGVIETAFIKN